MEGFYIHKACDVAPVGLDMGDNKIQLLAKQGELEIMLQPVVENATGWLVPAGDSSKLEFFFVHSGELELTVDGRQVLLGPGNSFHVQNQKEEILLKAKKDSLVLYISNCAVFDATASFQDELTRLVVQINEKDNYTFQHSRNVMRYSVRLYERLRHLCADTTADNIVVASLFHDVGKCYTPDEILKKKGRLTDDEYRKIIRHPLDSAKLLRQKFDEKVVELAQCHHERLDGSGYPFGLSGDEIPFECRILAVADVFDAMTTDRGYNRVKPFDVAVQELVDLPDQFDHIVTTTLQELVRSGAFIDGEADEEPTTGEDSGDKV